MEKQHANQRFAMRATIMLSIVLLTIISPQRLWAEIVTLTSETGQVILNDGDVLTGTGGTETYVIIAAGATVTLSGVDITSIPDDKEHLWAGLTCRGDATIVLAEGTNNNIKAGENRFPGIWVGPPNTTLTIRGKGSLTVRSGESNFAAAIGSGIYDAQRFFSCGNILIEDGNITAHGGFAGAAIGCSIGSSCGNITITGGNVIAENKYDAAIGGSDGTACGDITITGGTVSAESYYRPAIGSCAGDESTPAICGNITITGGTVNAKSFQTPAIGCGGGAEVLVSYCGDITITGGNVTAETGIARYSIGPKYEGNCTCGDITICNVVFDGIIPNPFVYNSETTICRVTFDKNNSAATGSMDDQLFFSTANQLLAPLGFNLKDYRLRCWTTEADGNGAQYYVTKKTTFTSDITLYAQWERYTFYITYNKNANDATGTMDDQPYDHYGYYLLANNTYSRVGYDFTGWNTKSDGSGEDFAEGQVIDIFKFKEDTTLYAQWILHNYDLIYNLDGGENNSANPATYTIKSEDITLSDPKRVGYIFDGWTYEGQDEPTKDVVIPRGSYGDITLTAHWTFTPNATITPETGEAVLYDGHILTGTGGVDTHVMITDGATVTLGGVDITSLPNNYNQWAGITCMGDATIILADGTVNNVKGGYYQFPGIFVPEGKTLTIRGNGALTARTNSITDYTGGAGIGAIEYENCGNIVIEGGNITAYGSKGAAAIGGAMYGACGNITITSGVTCVTAQTTKDSKYSIGAGNQRGCGTVTIGGVVTGSVMENPYTYKPSETVDRIITFDANGGEGSMPSQTVKSNIPISLNAVTFTHSGSFFVGWNTKADGSGTHYADGQIILNPSNMTLYAQWRKPNDVVTLTSQTGFEKLIDGNTLTGTGGTDTHVLIADGATVTLQDVDITALTDDENHQWAGINCEGDATIILKGINNVKGVYGHPGINCPWGKTLTIRGDGTLNATGSGGNGAPGIGEGFMQQCGYIVIEGGTINAYGTGGFTAGIGIAARSYIQGITITGGTINAVGEGIGAGIGSVYAWNDYTINITNGVTSVTATKGENAECCIGGGSTNFENITVSIAPELADETVDNTRTINRNHYYICADGTKKHHSVAILTGEEETLSEGWYYVCRDITYTKKLTLDGAVNIILGNGTTMSVGTSENPISGTAVDGGSYGGSGSLTIYAKTLDNTQAGTLKIYSSGGENAVQTAGDYTQHSGNVCINASGSCGIYGWNIINVYGGTFNVANTAGMAANAFEGIRLLGGKIEIISPNGTSLAALNGGITLGWTQITDRITADSYIGGVTIQSGQTFVDGEGRVYRGTLNSSDVSDLAHQTLMGATIIQDAAKNDMTADNGLLANVELYNRTLYTDGCWNTICLPFDVDDFTGTPLVGSTIMELNTQTSNLTDGILTLNFNTANSIKAGKPYIVKWNSLDLTDESFTAPGFILMQPFKVDGPDISSNNDSYGNLVDGNPDTKYSVAMSRPWVEFVYPSEFIPKAYAIWTANNNDGAGNPSSWVIKAWGGSIAGWETLASVDNSNGDKLPKANNKRTVFPLANMKAYRQYRFEAIRPGNSNFQLAELQFCDRYPFENLANLVNPIFENVTVSADTPTEVAFQGGVFKGTYDVINFNNENKDILFLGDQNTLYYPQNGARIGACRAFFELSDPIAVKEFRMSFGEEDDADGIGLIHNSQFIIQNEAVAVYDLAGRRLNSKFKIQNSKLPSGIYIVNGKKVLF